MGKLFRTGHSSRKQELVAPFLEGGSDEEGAVKTKGADQDGYVRMEEEDEEMISLWAGLWKIMKQSLPPIVGNFFHPFYMMINAVYLGRLKEDPRCETDFGFKHDHPADCISSKVYQSSFGIGSSTMSILLLAPVICFGLGLSNIIPQAFGAKNYHLCGAYANRMVVCMWMIFLPFLVPLQFSENMLLGLGIEKEIAYQASLYIRIVSPGVLLYSTGFCYQMLSILHGRPMASLVINAGASIVHAIVAYHLCFTLNMRMVGIAISSAIHFFCRMVIALIYTRLDPVTKKSLIPISHPDSFKDLKYMIKIGWDSFLLKVMGWWAFDVFTQLAGQLPDTQNVLAAQTNLRNIGLYTYMIPVGLSSAANFFSGKYIGKNNVRMAKRFASLCMWASFIWSIGTMSIMALFEEAIADFYSKDTDVQQAMYSAWHIIIIFVFFDCMQGVAAGLISGLNLVSKSRFVTIFAYWVVGIPISLVLMFKVNLGLWGLWWGPTAACAINYAAYTVFMNSANWQEIADKIIAKMKEHSANTEK